MVDCQKCGSEFLFITENSYRMIIRCSCRTIALRKSITVVIDLFRLVEINQFVVDGLYASWSEMFREIINWWFDGYQGGEEVDWLHPEGFGSPVEE